MVATAGPSLDVWPPQEFPGPLTINRPITVDFRDSTLWAAKGPVLTIKGTGICLRNACIEVTGDLTSDDDDNSAVAIQVLGRGKVIFENVKVTGFVRGIPGENGLWHIPRSLALGTLVAGEAHEFRIRLTVPTDCQLVVEGQGLAVTPQSLCLGQHEVTLQLEPGHAGPYSARVLAVTRSFKRCVTFTAYFCDAEQGQNTIKGVGQLIWPADNSGDKREAEDPEVEQAADTPQSSVDTETGHARQTEPEPGEAIQPEPERGPLLSGANALPPKRHARSVSIPNWVHETVDEKSSAESTEPSPPVAEAPQENPQEQSTDQPSTGNESTESRRNSGRPGKAFGL
jgi:hypothetical protein